MSRQLFALAFALSLATPAFADSLVGSWQRGDGGARVRIAPCGGGYCAVNTWIKDASGGEKVGDRLILKVKGSSAAQLRGTAFDPQRNLNFSMNINVGPKRMTTQGCVVGGLICKSMAWARIN